MSRVRGDLNELLTNQWQVTMCKAPQEAPANWCYGLCCPCCFAFQQRNQILDLTGEPYVCCGGSCCCVTCPCSSRQPWLCIETCCCTTPAIIANRYMIQTRFNVRNDPCDDNMLMCLGCLNCIACIIECFAGREVGEAVEHISHIINAMVCGCMLTQQDIELKFLEQQTYQGPPSTVYAALPPKQKQMIDARQALQQAPTAPFVVQGRNIVGTDPALPM